MLKLQCVLLPSSQYQNDAGYGDRATLSLGEAGFSSYHPVRLKTERPRSSIRLEEFVDQVAAGNFMKIEDFHTRYL